MTQFDLHINEIGIYNNTGKEEFNLYWNKYDIYKAHREKVSHSKWSGDIILLSG